MTRPDMSIKGKRKLRDMQILGRIARVRSTEQFVWHFLTLSSYINAMVISLQPRWACSGVGLWLNGFL